MARKVSDIKVTFLGVTPVLQDETGQLTPQEIVSLSALMTFKGKSVKDLHGEVKEKGQDLNKKVRGIIRKSSLRGHASVATTPAICFTYEASKFIDLLMTGMIFSSSLMTSGRRTNTTVDDIVIPDAINSNKEASRAYKKASEENINCLNRLLSQAIPKDDASKVSQYGIYGTGIIAYPLESIIAFKKEVEAQGEWMPEESRVILGKIEKELKKLGVELIYASRELSGRNVLPYPNPLKDPAKSNLARELIKSYGLSDDLTDVVDFHVTSVPGLEKGAREIVRQEAELTKDKKSIKKNWRQLLALRHDFCRDYYSSLQLKVLSSVSLRVWSERKRHRTVQMTPDSLYYSIDRTRPVLAKYRQKIEARKLDKDDVKKIDRYFTIPASVAKKAESLYDYLERVLDSFDAYYELIEKFGIKPSDAVYVMPRGVRIDMVQSHDLYNLIIGYFPLRTCFTAESQLRPITLLEMSKIKKVLKENSLSNLARLVVTKCQIPHFCLEEKNCPTIKATVKDYDEKFHEEMKAKLDEEMEERLSQL